MGASEYPCIYDSKMCWADSRPSKGELQNAHCALFEMTSWRQTMNQQCEECKIRKFCSLDEPEEDYTCESFVDESEYVRFMDS